MRNSSFTSRILFLIFLMSSSAFGTELPKTLIFEYGEGHLDTAAFHIELSEAGELKATMYSAPYPINKTPSKFIETRHLTKPQREKLIQLAMQADDFMIEGGNFHGVNATLIFDYDGPKFRKECFGSEKWPPGPKTEKFIVELKKYLPSNMKSEF